MNESSSIHPIPFGGGVDGRRTAEAGARVVDNDALRDLLILGIGPRDERRIEVVALNLLPFHGVLLCCDATLVSALDCNGGVAHDSDGHVGAPFGEVRRRNRRTYPELRSC